MEPNVMPDWMAEAGDFIESHAYGEDK